MREFFYTLKQMGSPRLGLQRLEADIANFETDFDRYRQGPMTKQGDPLWIESCEAHCARARGFLKAGDITSGYRSLLNAEREAVALMPDDERRSRVISLRHEVDAKLGDSWRGKSARLLLEERPEAVPVEAIREALFHRDTHSQNIYVKIQLLRTQLAFIGGLLALLLFIAVLVGISGGLNLLDQTNPPVGKMLPFAVYMGVLGGTLSAAFSVNQTDAGAKIPDVQRTRLIALTRSSLGGAAAVAVFLLIQGNVVKFMNMPFTPVSMLFFCFLAGFSERWFLGTLETFTKEKGMSDKSKKG